MICRTIFVLTILVLAFTAPNEERMPFVPVNNSQIRATPMTIRPQFTLAILILKVLPEKHIMCLLNLSKDQEIMIL